MCPEHLDGLKGAHQRVLDRDEDHIRLAIGGEPRGMQVMGGFANDEELE
jgi:hypothetical protein